MNDAGRRVREFAQSNAVFLAVEDFSIAISEMYGCILYRMTYTPRRQSYKQMDSSSDAVTQKSPLASKSKQLMGRLFCLNAFANDMDLITSSESASAGDCIVVIIQVMNDSMTSTIIGVR